MTLPEIAITIATTAGSLCFALYLFRLKREKSTFLDLWVNAKVVDAIGELLVVSIGVKIENKGRTRIDARRRDDIHTQHADYLYFDSGDQCKYAGTLKIRAVPSLLQPSVFDWYSLQTINNICILENGKQVTDDLEQINYLAEFQDPIAEYQDVDFWLEPSEQYNLQVMAVLPPGMYAVKAYFLGKIAAHREEEYWSQTQLFSLKNPCN